MSELKDLDLIRRTLKMALGDGCEQEIALTLKPDRPGWQLHFHATNRDKSMHIRYDSTQAYPDKELELEELFEEGFAFARDFLCPNEDIAFAILK